MQLYLNKSVLSVAVALIASQHLHADKYYYIPYEQCSLGLVSLRRLSELVFVGKGSQS